MFIHHPNGPGDANNHYLPSKSGHIWMSIDYGDDESKHWLQGNVLKMDTISQEI